MTTATTRNFFCALAFAFILSASCCASASAEEFRDNDFDFSSLKTVLVMPVQYDTKIPSEEAFFEEKTQQKWRELTDPEKTKINFLSKTPQEIVSRDSFVTGKPADASLTPALIAARAVKLAPQYVDAVLRMDVTQCEYKYVHHPEETYWDTRYETQSVRVDGKWVDVQVPIRYQRVRPAWDEAFACVTVKLELSDAKTGKLIYGNQLAAQDSGGLFSSVPSLTAETCSMMTKCAKKLPVKKQNEDN